MADTSAYYSGLLVSIDTKISALVASPEVDYKVGNTSVKASQKLSQLMELRELIVKRMNEKPEESITTLQTDFSVFGEDLNSYINEDLT